MTPTPIDLFTSAIGFHDGGRALAEPRRFDRDRDRDGWQLRAFHVRTDADVHADHWEIHADADEVVSCLRGGMRLYLRPERPGGEEEQVTLTAGTAVVVPRGRWHRIELDAPSDILAISVARGSRIEPRG